MIPPACTDMHVTCAYSSYNTHTNTHTHTHTHVVCTADEIRNNHVSVRKLSDSFLLCVWGGGGRCILRYLLDGLWTDGNYQRTTITREEKRCGMDTF